MNTRMCWSCGKSCGVGEAWCPSCGAPGVGTRPNPKPAMRMTPASFLALAGALAIGFGSFLPWVQATVPSAGTTLTQSGIAAGDGVVTLAFACAIATFGFVLWRGTAERWIGAALVGVGAVVALIIGVGFNELSNRFSDAHKIVGTRVITDYGIGLWVAAAGALVAIVAGGFAIRDEMRRRDRSGSRSMAPAHAVARRPEHAPHPINVTTTVTTTAEATSVPES